MSTTRAPIQQSSLVLRLRQGSGDKAYWDAQWRYRTDPAEPWRFKRSRIGLAWQEPDAAGGWRRRSGRVQDGWLDERAATVAAVAAMADHAQRLARTEEQARLERERRTTVRGLAREWLVWLEQVKGAKPSTLRDYETLLREPGSPHRRGRGVSEGRIMATFGDRPASLVTTTEVTGFLRGLDAAGFSPRNVNKYRQVLRAIFAYAYRSDTLALVANPVGRDRQAAGTCARRA